MKITKFLHSCLLHDDGTRKILIDPGNYTFEAKVLNVEMLEKLDYLLITHEHQDHMYPPLIKQILAKFPHVQIITNNSAKAMLEREGIIATTKLPDFIQIGQIPHERVFGTEPPENISFNISNMITHPGDSLHLSVTTPILALPVQAPWCSLTQAVEVAVSLKPKVILPIHDWHWNDTAREAFYNRLENYFASQGIRFIGLKTAEEVTV